MRVITVARKPLAGSVAANTLKFGTGGINIDGTRLSYLGDADAESATPQGRCTAKVGALAGGTQHDGDRSDFVRPAQKGRWPANLILQHLSGCRCTGTASLTGIRRDTRPEGDGGREDTTQWRYRPTDATRRGYANEDGVEQVASWHCEPGCPVKDLDEQSGIVPTGSWCRQKDGAHPFGDAVGSPYETWKAVEEEPGGAARYFKQIRDEEGGR